MKTQIEILYEDDDLVIINKPPKYLTLPDRYNISKPSLLGFLRKKYTEIFVVHRLDKETSGVLCFAKNAVAHKNLCQQFERRTTEKIYLALLEGHLFEKEGVIDKPIAPSSVIKGKMVIKKSGKSSITHYKMIEEFKHYSLVEANIKTGRTHQIRVHFESHGNPIAVDSIYGRQSGFYLSQVKLKKYRSGKYEEEQPLMNRTTLHAYRLTFAHPTTGEKMQFEAPLHKDFSAVLKQLRKWGK